MAENNAVGNDFGPKYFMSDGCNAKILEIISECFCVNYDRKLQCLFFWLGISIDGLIDGKQYKQLNLGDLALQLTK